MAGRLIHWTDLALTAFLLFFNLFGTGPAAANQGQTAPAAAYVLVVVACLPIVVWRWRPLWTFMLTGAATVLYIGLGYAYGPILVTLGLAIYGLAARGPVWRTVWSGSALLAAAVAAVATGIATGDRDWPELISVAAWVVIPVAVGVAVKVRRDATAHVRAEQARRAVSEERLHLAQEVHDVVGHGLAVIAMQAGVGLRLFDRDPDRARAALEAIRTTSTEVLDGLRSELDAMRREPVEAEAPRRPATTGLDDLPELVERIRSSGLPVTLEVVGPGPLPVEVEQAVYRIVQESLTNVLRHGGPEATAEVRVQQDGAGVRVEVLDTGPAAPEPPDAGQGLHGMRSRAESLGGTLEAGPRPSGGFAVRAWVPVPATEPTPGDNR